MERISALGVAAALGAAAALFVALVHMHLHNAKTFVCFLPVQLYDRRAFIIDLISNITRS
jgi:hypothetical protein